MLPLALFWFGMSVPVGTTVVNVLVRVRPSEVKIVVSTTVVNLVVTPMRVVVDEELGPKTGREDVMMTDVDEASDEVVWDAGVLEAVSEEPVDAEGSVLEREVEREPEGDVDAAEEEVVTVAEDVDVLVRVPLEVVVLDVPEEEEDVTDVDEDTEVVDEVEDMADEDDVDEEVSVVVERDVDEEVLEEEVSVVVVVEDEGADEDVVVAEVEMEVEEDDSEVLLVDTSVEDDEAKVVVDVTAVVAEVL
ncbi:hypothetical protein OH77DRAFT_1440232 [Trametes cingulata]|nr:hypothetical protein OH77DRAFT_1440232 [Trametes cingulata]